MTCSLSKVLVSILGFCLIFATGKSQELQWSYGRNDYMVPFEGVQRHFIIHVPQVYSGTEPVPVVFMFHGTTGDGEKYWNIGRWKELSEVENFIAVFPSSWHYLITAVGHMQTKWNTSGLHNEVADSSKLKDDVGLINRIIDALIETFNIDSTRIYASGFSNGAGFVETRILPEMNHRFAATANGGSLNRSRFEIDGPIPPTITMFGTRDNKIFEADPDTSVPFSIDGILSDTTVFRSINAHLITFGLSRDYDVDSMGNVIQYHFTDPLADKLTEWHLIAIKDMGHVYPNGNNWNFEIAPFFWEFFQNHSSDVTTSSESDHPAELPCEVPNPLPHDVLDLSCFNTSEGSWKLNAFDMLGRKVFSISNFSQPISLHKVPRGILFMEFQRSGKQSIIYKTIRQ